MTYTVEQIRAAVEDNSDTNLDEFKTNGRKVSWSNELVYDYPITDWYEVGESDGRIVIDGEAVDYTVVESDLGGEGHGEHVFFVFRIGNQLFRKEGYYASHYGTDWDGPLDEVEVYEKTVMDYRPI